MAITIAFALQKGGVGKSTTAETVAAILGSRGKKVLLVDMDSQSNVDTPPALGNLLKNSLVASDYAIIPTDARPFSIKGLDDLEPTLNAVKAVSDRFKVLGVVLVKYNERTVLNRQIKGLLTERVQAMDTVLFDTKIREGVAVAEAQALQISLIDYAPKSKPCMDYQLLTDEILQRVKG